MHLQSGHSAGRFIHSVIFTVRCSKERSYAVLSRPSVRPSVYDVYIVLNF